MLGDPQRHAERKGRPFAPLPRLRMENGNQKLSGRCPSGYQLEYHLPAVL